MSLKGKCNCNAISFVVDTPVKDVYICHCSICRRSTGGTGIAVAIVSNENFSWLTGMENISTWDKPNHDWQTSFCSVCGSPVPGKNDESNTYIPVSLLCNGVENMKVVHHLFVDSKATWEVIGDAGKQHSSTYVE